MDYQGLSSLQVVQTCKQAIGGDPNLNWKVDQATVPGNQTVCDKMAVGPVLFHSL